jgi:hypothetical protein
VFWSRSIQSMMVARDRCSLSDHFGSRSFGGHLIGSTSVEAEAPIDLEIKAQRAGHGPAIRIVIITASSAGGGSLRDSAPLGVLAKPSASLDHLARPSGGRARYRSADLTLFRRALYQLSYPTG